MTFLITERRTRRYDYCLENLRKGRKTHPPSHPIHALYTFAKPVGRRNPTAPQNPQTHLPMNDKMKTTITTIAVACLCACTSTNEQAKIQPPRTAYTAPAQTESKEEAILNAQKKIFQLLGDGQERPDETYDERMRRLWLAPTRRSLKQCSDETLIFLHQEILKQNENKPPQFLLTEEGLDTATFMYLLGQEMGRRGIMKDKDKKVDPTKIDWSPLITDQ